MSTLIVPFAAAGARRAGADAALVWRWAARYFDSVQGTSLGDSVREALWAGFLARPRIPVLPLARHAEIDPLPAALIGDGRRGVRTSAPHVLPQVPAGRSRWTIGGGAGRPASAAEAGRYRSQVFDRVEKIANVAYSTAPGRGGVNQTLRLDIYRPAGDQVSRRPLSITAFAGAFMPAARTSRPTRRTRWPSTSPGWATSPPTSTTGCWPTATARA